MQSKKTTNKQREKSRNDKDVSMFVKKEHLSIKKNRQFNEDKEIKPALLKKKKEKKKKNALSALKWKCQKEILTEIEETEKRKTLC